MPNRARTFGAVETEPPVVNSRQSHRDRDAAARSTDTLGVVQFKKRVFALLCLVKTQDGTQQCRRMKRR
jgi:hypothetical protein